MIMAERTSEVREVRCVTDFLLEVFKIANNDRNLNCYRGQSDKEWDITPAILRKSNENIEINERSAIKDLLAAHPEEFKYDSTMLDKLVRLQHFGMPTRLLDVTKNPLVALYFATEQSDADGTVTCFSVPDDKQRFFDSDTLSILSNLSNLTSAEKDQLFERLKASGEAGIDAMSKIFNEEKGEVKKLIHFIRQEKSYFDYNIWPPDIIDNYYVHPRLNNPRILAQAGAFIMFGLFFSRYESGAQIEEETIIIPSDSKGDLRLQLEILGISESILFPELERSTLRVRNRYS